MSIRDFMPHAFHAHLDACEQCREHPFELCPIGAVLLRAAAERTFRYSDRKPKPGAFQA